MTSIKVNFPEKAGIISTIKDQNGLTILTASGSYSLVVRAEKQASAKLVLVDGPTEKTLASGGLNQIIDAYQKLCDRLEGTSDTRLPVEEIPAQKGQGNSGSRLLNFLLVAVLIGALTVYLSQISHFSSPLPDENEGIFSQSQFEKEEAFSELMRMMEQYNAELGNMELPSRLPPSSSAPVQPPQVVIGDPIKVDRDNLPSLDVALEEETPDQIQETEEVEPEVAEVPAGTVQAEAESTDAEPVEEAPVVPPVADVPRVSEPEAAQDDTGDLDHFLAEAARLSEEQEAAFPEEPITAPVVVDHAAQQAQEATEEAPDVDLPELKPEIFQDMNEEEAKEVLGVLEEVKEGLQTDGMLNSEVLKRLPHDVARTLLEAGLVNPHETARDEKGHAISKIPPHIMETYRNIYGIASIPENDTWTAAGGKVTLPLPGGGDIRRPEHMQDFGLEP